MHRSSCPTHRKFSPSQAGKGNHQFYESFGLHHGSITVVDRGKPIKAGNMVHVRYNGDEIMRRLVKRAGQWFLQADDPRIQDVLISEDDIVERLGVVTAAIIFIE